MLKITKAGFAEYTVNKSRFIAVAEYCEDERAAAICLRKLASQHQSAHHLAYAFRLKTEQGIVQRFSDAGEPSGTAGKPILQFLEGRDLINVCVGVIRYYGGINLGTGGLARAYGGTGKLKTIDGMADISEVTRQIEGVLKLERDVADALELGYAATVQAYLACLDA